MNLADSHDDNIIVNDETVLRYKRNYNISLDAVVTPAMIEHHWHLERLLTKQLLNSAPEDRWSIWESCYSQLYSECSWLNKLPVADLQSEETQYSHFPKLMREAKRVYEVGSGEGGLIKFLATRGYECVGTEVTRERSARRQEQPNLEWHTTDGVHLSRLEPLEYYDIVLSTQVIEHLHPEDLSTHFSEALKILRLGGRYIFTTPHRFLGPADLSRVFRKSRPMCMHLKEYLYSELWKTLKNSGFSEIQAVYLPPAAVRRYLPWVLKSRAYLSYMVSAEAMLEPLSRSVGTPIPRLLLRMLFFTGDIFIIAKK